MSKVFLLNVGAAALMTALIWSTANAGQSSGGSSSSASAGGGSFASASVGGCCNCGTPGGGNPRDPGSRPEVTGSGSACASKKFSSRHYKWIASSSSECGCAWRMTGGETKWMCPVKISSAKRK